MFCQSCGKENPAGAEFCHHCGKPMPQPAATTPTAARPHAGFWLRFAAVMIDGILYGTVSSIILFLMIGLLFASVMSDPTATDVEPAFIAIFLVVYLALWLGWFLYHAYFESTEWQGSLGKKAVGLYVTDNSGNRLTFGRALGRNLSKMLSDMTVGIGYIMAGFTEKKQALHDIVADCFVLRRP